MPFTFNAVDLYVVTINGKPWTRAEEVFNALKYNKKTADIIKAFCGQEGYAQMYQMIKFLAAENFVDWPKDSRKDECFINGERVYELLFSSQQPKVKNFRKY